MGAVVDDVSVLELLADRAVRFPQRLRRRHSEGVKMLPLPGVEFFLEIGETEKKRCLFIFLEKTFNLPLKSRVLTDVIIRGGIEGTFQAQGGRNADWFWRQGIALIGG